MLTAFADHAGRPAAHRLRIAVAAALLGAGGAAAAVATVADSTPTADRVRSTSTPRARRRPGRGRDRRGRRHRRRSRPPRSRPRRPRLRRRPRPRGSRPPTDPAAGRPASLDPAACAAAANHGAYVSFVAHATKGDARPRRALAQRGRPVRLRRRPRRPTKPADEADAKAEKSTSRRRARSTPTDGEEAQGNRTGGRPRPARRKATGRRSVGHDGCRCPAAELSLRRRAVRLVSGGASRVPVPHPLRVADDGGVVRRDAEPVGELVRGPRRRGPGAGSTHPCWRRTRRSWSRRWSAARRTPRRRCGCRRTASRCAVSAASAWRCTPGRAASAEQSHRDLLPPSSPVSLRNGRAPAVAFRPGPPDPLARSGRTR